MSNALVSTTWLANHLHDDNLRIVDIRGLVKPATEPPPHYFNKHDDYLRSHIPGAVFTDWVKEITDPADPRHTQVAPPQRYTEVMQRAGISNDAFVVIYDDNGGIFAPRLWWTLNYYGHTQAAVLDGGFKKWMEEGHPTTTEVPTPALGSFTPQVNAALRRTGDDILAKLGTDALIVDVRSSKEYNGEASRASRAGHIPGALHNHRATIMNDDGTLQSPEAIRAHFESIGIKDNSPEVILYCNAGVSASYTFLALHHAGYRNIALYDASWKEWGNDDTKPID